MKELNVSAFERFGGGMVLLTAGDIRDYNTMTIGWGGLGTLWSKPAVTVYVKPIRYTYGFMERNELFTVSFFPEEYMRDLIVLGTRSGRCVDKIALTRLTPRPLDGAVTFEEATATLLCRKMYAADLIREAIPDGAKETYYKTEAPHRMYIGEALDIL